MFKVDQTLLHPAPGFDNAVVKVESTIRKAVVKKVKGKKRGFFESAGKCRKKKSAIKVTFHQVDGSSPERLDDAEVPVAAPAALRS